jgi:hypothetical protein
MIDMTVEEKSKKIEEYCNKRKCCEECKLDGAAIITCYSINSSEDAKQVEENYKLLFETVSDSTANRVNIEQMDAVIQDYCNDHDCLNCAISNICASIGGSFYTHPYECEEAYKIIKNLSKVDPNANPVNDPVNHPSHYNKGKIEVADFIADQKLNFDRGNAVKYVCRAGSKDPEKEIQDLEKAIWYINHEIKMLKGDCENA